MQTISMIAVLVSIVFRMALVVKFYVLERNEFPQWQIFLYLKAYVLAIVMHKFPKKKRNLLQTVDVQIVVGNWLKSIAQVVRYGNVAAFLIVDLLHSLTRELAKLK